MPRPTREVAGTRTPNRGAYQPSIGSTVALWELQVSPSGSKIVPRLRSVPTCQESVARFPCRSTATSGPRCHDSRSGTAAATSKVSTTVKQSPTSSHGGVVSECEDAHSRRARLSKFGPLDRQYQSSE
jgi:hypothetical protein